jgi:hypothetical protein
VSKRREQRRAVREMKVDPPEPPCSGGFRPMPLTLPFRVNGAERPLANLLDKSKDIDYVLMGEHTQSAAFVRLV